MMTTTSLLAGIRVIEAGGIGPVPQCAMLLADLGAEVVTVACPDRAFATPVTDRGKTLLTLDLGKPASRTALARLANTADVLIEGFRPGVMERLELGPERLRATNRRLVYGRLTGWGQTGPLARRAGHDIDYIALSGMLLLMGRPDDAPLPPLNLVGDYAGGALTLAFAIAATLLRRTTTGEGATIDASILDGTAALLASHCGYRATGLLDDDQGRSLLSGAAPLYRCYVCADGRAIALGTVEPQFRAILAERLGVTVAMFGDDADPDGWPETTERLAALFATRPRDEWCALLEPVDACAAPVLSLEEAASHPHVAARGTYRRDDRVLSPQLAFRLAGEDGAAPRTPARIETPGDVLARWSRR